MKLVTAVLAPDKLDAVAAALAEAEVYRMTVTECRGVTRPAHVAGPRAKGLERSLLPGPSVAIVGAARVPRPPSPYNEGYPVFGLSTEAGRVDRKAGVPT